MAKFTSWQWRMYNRLAEVAKRQTEFTNDDVFDCYDQYYERQTTSGWVTVPDRRSYGNVVQKAITDGIMEWTGHAVVSKRKNCHKMLIRVYKSLVYKPLSNEPYSAWQSFKKWWRW